MNVVKNFHKKVFPARLELATFRVLGGRDNHYTKETKWKMASIIELFKWRISKLFITLSIPTEQ